METQVLVPVSRWALALAFLAVAPELSATDDPAWALPSRIDLDGDGTPEIDRLETYVGTPPASEGSAPIFVFVEERLARLSASEADDPLRRVVSRLADDLSREGYSPWVTSVSCPPADSHRDGRYVLAFRRLMRAAKDAFPGFRGALFVGHFPEAMLVRTVNWQRDDAFTLRAGKPDETKYPEGTCWIRSVPELVAHRADIVLADLDGRWEECYVEARTALPSVSGAFPAGFLKNGAGIAADAEWGSIEYEDFFHLADGLVTRTSAGTDFLDPRVGSDAECSPVDAGRRNRMAVPDLSISRIDARGVALSLRPELRDEHGRPRAASLPDGAKNWHRDPWIHDPRLELALLVEYFDRNHAYRVGELEPSFRPASIAHGLWSGFDELRKASPAWKSIDPAGLDLKETDLVAVAKWFATPAVLRTIRAHSDPWGSMFDKTEIPALEAAAGGVAWSFAVENGVFTPSLGPACAGGKLDFFLLKTLHENGLTGRGASFYLHTGCEAISPGGCDRLPFSHPDYGLRNGAESLLFLADGLALVGRAKVFYDEPRGFCEALGEGATIGEAYRRYFELESAAAKWSEVGDDIGRKRAYFWSVLGDWTLRLRNPTGT